MEPHNLMELYVTLSEPNLKGSSWNHTRMEPYTNLIRTLWNLRGEAHRNFMEPYKNLTGAFMEPYGNLIGTLMEP